LRLRQPPRDIRVELGLEPPLDHLEAHGKRPRGADFSSQPRDDLRLQRVVRRGVMVFAEEHGTFCSERFH
jgi:hypothetical protein